MIVFFSCSVRLRNGHQLDYFVRRLLPWTWLHEFGDGRRGSLHRGEAGFVAGEELQCLIQGEVPGNAERVTAGIFKCTQHVFALRLMIASLGFKHNANFVAWRAALLDHRPNYTIAACVRGNYDVWWRHFL